MKKHIWGVLAGGAVGDAMGMPTECWSQEKILRIYPQGVDQLYASDEHDVFGRRMVAGSITDDTINTVMIIEMIKKNNGRICVQDFINELVEWTTSSSISAFVSGPSTLKALDNIAKGMPIEKTGISGTTNGASMKIAPVGILSDYQDMHQLVKNVYEICLPTHNTKIAIAGASAVAAAISYVVRGGTSIQILWKLAYEAIEISKPFGYDFPSASLAYRMQQAQQILNETKDEKLVLKRLYEEIGTGVETIETIPSVFAIVELANGNAYKAAQLSASIGWDTDTIGAISCAICGGMNPEFPDGVITTIEEVNTLDFCKLSDCLLAYMKD